MTDPDRIKYCKACRDAGQQKPGDCKECEKGSPPEALMPENEEALELMSSVKTQWRGAGFGVIGLDYTALYREADDMEIDLSPCMKGKIRAVEAVELERMNRKKD